MKIIDTFMFFDENMMLDIRLNILDKYINKFIICESTYNHNGEAKKLNFDLNLFSKFKSKIVYVVLEKKQENLKLSIKGKKLKSDLNLNIGTLKRIKNLSSNNEQLMNMLDQIKG